jgi:hypothetical protein
MQPLMQSSHNPLLSTMLSIGKNNHGNLLADDEHKRLLTSQQIDGQKVNFSPLIAVTQTDKEKKERVKRDEKNP